MKIVLEEQVLAIETAIDKMNVVFREKYEELGINLFSSKALINYMSFITSGSPYDNYLKDEKRSTLEDPSIQNPIVTETIETITQIRDQSPDTLDYLRYFSEYGLINRGYISLMRDFTIDMLKEKGVLETEEEVAIVRKLFGPYLRQESKNSENRLKEAYRQVKEFPPEKSKVILQSAVASLLHHYKQLQSEAYYDKGIERETFWNLVSYPWKTLCPLWSLMINYCNGNTANLQDLSSSLQDMPSQTCYAGVQDLILLSKHNQNISDVRFEQKIKGQSFHPDHTTHVEIYELETGDRPMM
ncbi:MAG: hypothetical protein ABIG89_06780 [Candidatus Woesearchaeota archaeon]